jgi:hypothetical protein
MRALQNGLIFVIGSVWTQTGKGQAGERVFGVARVAWRVSGRARMGRFLLAQFRPRIRTSARFMFIAMTTN